MKRLTLYIIIILSLSSSKILAQDITDYSRDSLETLFGRLVNNYNDTVRIRINDSIKLIVNRYVRSDSVFVHSFSGLRYLGQITSSDSAVKIVTWNLVLANSPGKYFCYIIRKADKGQRNIVTFLSSTYNSKPIRIDTTYSSSDWYGALYYDLMPVVADRRTYYVLLGIDYGNLYVSRKLIDVLDFTDNGSVLFGKKWFSKDGNLSFREVLEYSSSGVMTLRFSSDTSIVFDHLVPFSSSQKDDRQFYGSDYSFDSYKFENGLWKFYLNVDARNKE